MRPYQAMPPRKSGEKPGRLVVWANEDGTWSGSLCNAHGTSVFDSANFDPDEVNEWVVERIGRLDPVGPASTTLAAAIDAYLRAPGSTSDPDFCAELDSIRMYLRSDEEPRAASA